MPGNALSAVSFTLTPEIVAQINATAAKLGVNRSAYIRSLVENDIHASPSLSPGMTVTHKKHGVGVIVSEWTPGGVFDVEFGTAPRRFVHCCRSRYLQRLIQ